jgi:hypothetical protein
MPPGSRPNYVLIVPTRTLDDILDEAEAPSPIDFLSIDVEGHEVEVLRGFEFARWRPRLIMIEDHVRNLQTHRFLIRKGYRIVRRLGNNGWYVAADMPVTISPSERWEILRKYYLALPFRMLRNALRRLRQACREMIGGG